MSKEIEKKLPVAAATTCSRSSDAKKYADPSGPRRMRGCSQERVEEQLRIALDGHPESELWGENGLIAATMRCVDALGKVTDERDEARTEMIRWFVHCRGAGAVG